MEILGIPLKSMVINAAKNAMKLGKNSAIRIVIIGLHVPIRKEPIMEPAHRQPSARVMQCGVPVVTNQRVLIVSINLSSWLQDNVKSTV
ncbi:MAG: hypothetical protein QF704_07140 [Anaerolineales bacterium]|nr:hypothetical protein [Anaerolineales bacterium]